MVATTPVFKSSDSSMGDNKDEHQQNMGAALSGALPIEGGSVSPNHTQPVYDSRQASNSMRSLSIASEISQASSHGRRGEPSSSFNGPHSSNGIETLAEPGNIYESAGNSLPQLAEAQHQPSMPHWMANTHLSSPNSNASRAVLPAVRLRQELEGLEPRQESARMIITGGSPRTPQRTDFPLSLSVSIVAPTTDEVEHCIVLLHHSEGNEESLSGLAKRLQRSLAESTFVLIRGLQAVRGGNRGYHWADAPRELKSFRDSTDILDQFIKKISNV